MKINLNFFTIKKFCPGQWRHFLNDVIEILYVIWIITLLDINIVVDVIGWEPLSCLDIQVFTRIILNTGIAWAMKKLNKSSYWLTNQKQSVDCCWISLHIILARLFFLFRQTNLFRIIKISKFWIMKEFKIFYKRVKIFDPENRPQVGSFIHSPLFSLISRFHNHQSRESWL